LNCFTSDSPIQPHSNPGGSHVHTYPLLSDQVSKKAAPVARFVKTLMAPFTSARSVARPRGTRAVIRARGHSNNPGGSLGYIPLRVGIQTHNAKAGDEPLRVPVRREPARTTYSPTSAASPYTARGRVARYMFIPLTACRPTKPSPSCLGGRGP
jgi:hypothetical protein